MTTDPIPIPTRELPLEYRTNIAYFKLAYQCMLPAAKALSAGKQDIDALLAVAFSPVMHALLACMAPTNAWGHLVAVGVPGSAAGLLHLYTVGDIAGSLDIPEHTAKQKTLGAV